METNKQRDLLQDLIANPKHKGLTVEERNRSYESTVAACEDLFHIYINVDNGIVKEAKFEGDGCSISKGSVEAVLRTIEGKTTKEVEDILNTYNNFIDDEINETDFEILNVFEIVHTHLSRRKCAKAPIGAIRKAIK